jgi:hypothetical protein
MFLKLMEGDGYRIIEVSEVAFRRFPEPMVIYINGTGEEKTVALSNHAFLQNDAGATIESFFVRGRR